MLDGPTEWAEAIGKASNPFAVALDRYHRAPIGFVKEVLGATPDPWQHQVLRALARGHTRLAIRSCHGPGKTCLAAWVITWFANTRAPFKVAVTAPTSPQLFDALYPELLKWFQKLPLSWRNLWVFTADHVTLKGDQESFITARTARPEQPEAMQGLHSPNILLVGDEASGIDERVYEAAMGSMSSPNAITLLIGNPTRSTGFFYRVHTLERDRWFTMKVGAADSPRVSQSYVDEMERRYGPDSNAFRIRVLGEFPNADDDTMIPAELVDSAMGRDTALDLSAPIIWGLDVARFGNDSSVLIKRQGYVVTEMPRRWHGWDTMQVAGAVKHEFDVAGQAKPSLIVIDSIGIGAGVVDRLHEQGVPVLGVNVAEAPAKAANYMRLRDELWGLLKEWLATRRCRLPRDEQFRDDLCAPRFSFTSTGKLLVETKQSMRTRGLASCDSADALMLTLAQQGMMITSEENSGLFANEPLMGAVPGSEI